MIEESLIRNTKICVWKNRFAVIQATAPNNNAFANIIDKKETTVIIDELQVDDDEVIQIERGWKILTFDTVLPFDVVGFLAKVSQVLAEQNISIFAVSAYSTDHILVKENDLQHAIKTLVNLGFVCNESIE